MEAAQRKSRWRSAGVLGGCLVLVGLLVRQPHPGAWSDALAAVLLLAGLLVAVRLLGPLDRRRVRPWGVAILLGAAVVGVLLPGDAVIAALFLDHPFVFVIAALWLCLPTAAPAKTERDTGETPLEHAPTGAVTAKLRARPMVVSLIVATVVLAVVARGCAVSNLWMGSSESDLAALNKALDITIDEAHLRVPDRKPGGISRCFDDMGPPTRSAGATVTIDLAGENAHDVSRRIAAVWREHADEWFGGGGQVNDRQVDLDRPRVTLYKGGGGLEAQLYDNTDLPYTIGAHAPCYV
jgi:hypothetical protein